MARDLASLAEEYSAHLSSACLCHLHHGTDLPCDCTMPDHRLEVGGQTGWSLEQVEGVDRPCGKDRLRLMVIDDCALIRSITQRIAQRLGFDTLPIHDGASALKALGQYRPDFVALDLEMPGMDGLTCLQAIRAAQPETLVVIFSDTLDESSRKLCMDLGAADCISKPFTVSELESHFHRLRTMRADRDEIIPPT
ncbi:MAG TPA: response regulator [Phycisphaerae bacterium]|nr:response regulator [Phycisphaerae bacterium]HRY66626.1 response regulator [Phycisphaerae bacterium]HSA29083.1 response regulator [Phycisphaerae bacterium]